ncbi:MAG: PEP-CTERM sorting domain-containing protein [Gammaproteobacteria bacterium]
MNNVSIKHGITGCILAAALGAGSAAHAVPIDWSFSATVASGPYAGTVGTGLFSYDTDDITGVGLEALDPTLGLTISFEIFGQSFTESDDIDFDDFPLLSLLDGFPIDLDFLIVDGAPTDILEPGVVAISIEGELVPGTSVRFLAPVVILALGIPEPAAAALLGLGLLGLRTRRPQRA